jgi:DNA-directed RNA polymerase I subunit RPA43
MSTAIDTPLSWRKKSNKETSSKQVIVTATNEASENSFSDFLLNRMTSPPVNGAVTSKIEKSPKKRQYNATSGAEREETPAKKSRTAKESSQSIPTVTRMLPPNGHPSQEPPNVVKRKTLPNSTPVQLDFAEEPTRRLQQSPSVGPSNRTSQGITLKPARTSAVPGLPSELESPFVSTTASFKVTVPPVAQLYPLEGALAHYISPLLLTWHTQLDGVLLSYNNAKLHTQPPRKGGKIAEEQPMAQAVDECAALYVWLTLDTLVFKPKKGLDMEGYLNLQNESHITLILWNFFTVTISQERLPKGWVWQDHYEEGTSSPNIESEDKPMRRENEQWGAWYDATGNEIQGSLRFRVKDWDCAPAGSNGEGSFLSIEGSMLTDEEEEDLRRVQQEDARQRREALAAPRAKTPLPSALRRSTPANGRAHGSSPVQSTPTTGKKTRKSTKS